MYDTLARRAILAALANDWILALDSNLTILADNPEDIDALNRAAKACLQTGNISEAVNFSKKVLAIDPLNPIAIKFLAKCHAYQPNGKIPSSNSRSPEDFLEIPGITKIVTLVNLCDSAILAHLDSGECVQMTPKTHKVAVHTLGDVYIGRLPDDLASRMIFYIKQGNEYESFIKSATTSEVKLFIKETKKSEALSNIASFPLR